MGVNNIPSNFSLEELLGYSSIPWSIRDRIIECLHSLENRIAELENDALLKEGQLSDVERGQEYKIQELESRINDLEEELSNQEENRLAAFEDAMDAFFFFYKTLRK